MLTVEDVMMVINTNLYNVIYESYWNKYEVYPFVNPKTTKVLAIVPINERTIKLGVEVEQN